MEAAAIGYSYPDSYYRQLSDEYRDRRDFLAGAVARSRVQVRHAGRCLLFFCRLLAISKDDDVTFAKWMTREIGVATVPGSSSTAPALPRARSTRVSRLQAEATLEKAVEKLAKLKQLV